MKISGLIKELEKLKGQYGDLNVIYGYSDSTVDYIEPVKYIIRYNEFIQEKEMDTEDLEEDYLEKTYNKNDILDSGMMVKIY